MPTPPVHAVVVPQLDVNDLEMELVSWTVEHGEEVDSGSELCTLETAKATHELTCEVGGVVHRAASERSTVSVGDVIAWIGESAAAIEGHLATLASEGDAAGDGADAAPRVTPRAEALCREHGLDPAAVPRKGSVLKEKDVQRFLDAGGAAAPAPPAGEAAPGPLPDAVRGLVEGKGPLARHRVAIARHLSETQRGVVFATVETEVDVTAAEALLAREEGLVNLFHLVLHRVARLLDDYPLLRSFRHAGELYEYRASDLAFTLVDVDRDYRLVTPVVRGAGGSSPGEIAERCVDLTLKTYRGEIDPADLQGGAFTVSMLTGLPVTRFTALQNQYQSAVLAVGSPVERVVPDGAGGVCTARVATLTLSYDHGVCDGFYCGEFLADLADALSEDELESGR